MIDRSGEAVRLNRSAEHLLDPDLRLVRRRIVSWSRDATQVLDRALHDLILCEARGMSAASRTARQGGPIVAILRVSPARCAKNSRLPGLHCLVDLQARPAGIAAGLARL
jgi:hypothetical protein